MRRLSLRTRLAFWTGGMAVGVLLIFGATTLGYLYHEQMEAFLREENQGRIGRFNFRAEAREIVGHMAKVYLLSAPVGVAAAALGGWLIGVRALRPVREIARTADQINGSSLTRRLPVPEHDDEVGDMIQVLNRMFDRLEKNFEQATRFSADASHELRTPLAILRAEIEAALRDEDEQGRLELLERLLNQTMRLSAIAEKLLLLSRADAGKLRIDAEPVDLSDLCEGLAEDAQILAAAKKISIESQVAPGVAVPGDRALLQQALLNLLENALKYNEEEGRVGIRLEIEEKSRKAVFRIENTGPGIPAGLETRIFDRFVRADSSRDRATGGSGLGLSLVREIVVAHGGGVRLVPAPAGMTAFEASLPLAGESA